ncbi:hypothetical protein BOTBODRAFT_175688 [Botryobasidium botryosum FD-172 SS1]|uniref:Uncharacterized protein n=1 Tax=Botryobasidium botryosum (strain FD-172 SS1) TaxID=930990 RepID=A0A067MCB7_BOTB1|nr:hypothetical protein BOTBODRAFT_175688 [Botryobasidium botryosum FD-172 SS1]
MSPSSPEYQQIPLVIDENGRTLRTVKGVVDLQMPDAPAELAPVAETKAVVEDLPLDSVKSARKNHKGKEKALPTEATPEPLAKESKALRKNQKAMARRKASKKTPKVLADDVDVTESDEEGELINLPSPTPSDDDDNADNGDLNLPSNTQQLAQSSRSHGTKKTLSSSQYGGGPRGNGNHVATDPFGNAPRTVQQNQFEVITQAQSHQPPALISAKERGRTPAAQTGYPPRNTHTFGSSQPASRPLIDPYRYNLSQSSIWSDNHSNPPRPSGTDPAAFGTPYMSTLAAGLESSTASLQGTLSPPSVRPQSALGDYWESKLRWDALEILAPKCAS